MPVPAGPVPDPAANRTDLNVPGPPAGPPPGQGQPNGQPIAVPTGTPYGEATQLRQAQQAVPLPKGAPAPQAAPGAPPAPVDMGQALQAAKNFQMPNRGSLTRPSERPGEPVTAGLPNGPAPMGGGGLQQQSDGSIASMLTKMASATGSAALSQLAGRAASVGQ